MTLATFVETPEYNIRGEFVWFGVILHSEVRAMWTKGLRGRFKRDLRHVASCVSLPLYAFQAPYHDPKKQRFIRDVGMVRHHRRKDSKGVWCDLYLLRPLD